MIITVTMNPAIDKTVEVDKFQPYALNRIRRIEYDVGGKGINVSRELRSLSEESVCLTFCDGGGELFGKGSVARQAEKARPRAADAESLAA